MHTHTHTNPANRHPSIPVQHGPLTPGSPKKLCPRCPTGNTPALAKVPPTSAGTWVQDWDPHTEASASPPWHTVRGQSRIYFPPAQIHPTPLCPYLCAHTSRGQEGHSRDQGRISGGMRKELLFTGTEMGMGCEPWLRKQEVVHRHCPGAAAPFAGGGFWAEVASANPWHAALQTRAQNYSGQRELPAVTPWGEMLTKCFLSFGWTYMYTAP